MKKLVLMIAMFVGVTAFAQERKMEQKRMSAEDKVERLTKELDLTAEQQAKVKEIYAKKAENKKAKRTEVMTTRKARSEAFDKELRSVLTPEQNKKLNAKKKNKSLKEARKKKSLKQIRKNKLL